MLQLLRAFSFGGRLNQENNAKLAVLLAYYPSLRTLSDLLEHPVFAEGANAFLPKMAIPADLRAWLVAALKTQWPTQVSQSETSGSPAQTVRGDQLPSAPCGTSMPRAADVYDRRLSDDWFQVCDVGLELFVARYGAFGRLLDNEFGRMTYDQKLAAVRAYDRVLALGLEPGPKESVDAFIHGTVWKVLLENDREMAMAVAKLCMRVGLDPARLMFRGSERVVSSASFNEAWAAVERVSQGVAAPLMATAAPAMRRRVLEQLAAGPVSAMEVKAWMGAGQGVVLGEVLPALLAAKAAGQLQRVNYAQLGDSDKADILARLHGLPHPVCTLVLAALLFDGVDEDLRKVWQEQGFGDKQSAVWATHVRRLRGLAPRALAYALADVLRTAPQGGSLPLRLHLAGNHLTDSGAVQSAFGLRDCLDERAAIEILAAHAAGDPEEQAALQAWLQGPNRPSPSVLNELFAHGGFRKLLPQIDAVLEMAVARCRALGCTSEANAQLQHTLLGLSASVPPAVLVEAVLGELHRSDVERVLPLTDVDATTKQARQSSNSSDGVDVAGVWLPVSNNPAQDRRAVPRKIEADLVMTSTTETNLWRLATMVRAGKSVLLEGPTSAGKTAAVRYLAYRTNNPLRRVTLSFRSEVADLIGRWVAGVERYKAAELDAMSQKQIDGLAREFGAESATDRATQQAEILKKQKLPRWVDGLVVQAVRRGEWLILDEINLAQAEVIERLNSLFDDDGNITLESGEKVPAHPNFRAFATMNPGTYVGRGQLSDALRSRWARVFCQGLSRADLTQILKVRFGEAIPTQEMKKLLVVHSLLSEAADKGSVARNLGGISYSLRNLRNVCERFIAYRGRGLSDAELMRRETEEVYRDGLPPSDVQVVDDVLTAAMPYEGPGFHDNLQLTINDDSITIGDVTLPCIGPRDPASRAMLVPTPRTLRLLYRLAKIIDRGENALLIGGKASGKTALVAMLSQLLGQPYQRQMIGPATDTMQLVGSYTTQGWQDGVILQGGRPENTPAITLLDEINLGDSATLERLNGAFEKDDRTVVLTEGDGSVVRLHAQSHLVGAMNPPGEKYGGRKRLSKALQNRMTAVYVPELTEREELQLIVRGMAARKIADAGVAQVVADALLEAHQWVVDGYARRDLPPEARRTPPVQGAQPTCAPGSLGQGLLGSDKPVMSIRTLLRALDVTVELMRDMSVGQAFVHAIEVSYASEASQTDNQAIMQMARLLAA